MIDALFKLIDYNVENKDKVEFGKLRYKSSQLLIFCRADVEECDLREQYNTAITLRQK